MSSSPLPPALAGKLPGSGALAIALILVAIGSADPELLHRLEYQRDKIPQGEWWRLISCHFVHLSIQHSLGNALGIVLIWLISLTSPHTRPGIGSMLISGAAIGIGLHILATDLPQYAGFSGILHGLLMLTAMRVAQDTPEYYLFILALCCKVAWEFTPWYDEYALQTVIGGRVEYRAHALGLASGGACHLIMAMCQRLPIIRRTSQ